MLSTLPRPLPVSLRRLLVDGNRVENVEDADTFPVRSQLMTLSLAGNHVRRLSPTALQRLTNLQYLDLSNNQLHHIDTATFSANTNLRSLTLAKNPLNTIQTGAFDGLRTLKSLSLSYVSTVDIQLSATDLFRPLSRLSRLDFDNSPGIAKAVLWTPVGDERPSHVEELGLVNCDLTTLPRDFSRRFPRLSALRISSSRWHCDRALRWFRDWLLDQGVDVRVQSRSDIRCATPQSVRHRPLVSLNDDEFVESTWTPLPPPTSTSTTTPTTTTSTSTTTTTTTVKDKEPEIHQSAGHRSTASPLYPAVSEFDEVEQRRSSTHHASTSSSNAATRPSSLQRDVEATDSRSTASLTALTHLKSSTSATHRHRSGHRPHSHHHKHGNHSKDDGDEHLWEFETRLIIAAVIGATLVVAAVIVAAIVYFWRRNRNPPAKTSMPPPPSLSASAYDDDTLASGTSGTPTPRTFIKYKNKNGVLFFSTPADSPSTLTTTGAPDEATPDSCLIGQTDGDGTGTIRYVLPPSSAGYKTRVYRWEDF